MTPNYDLSDHAAQRLQQRGFKHDDLPLLLECSSAIDEDVLQLLDGDVDREVAKRKREIRALERLRGCQVVTAGQQVVTIYQPSKRRTKRNLRRRRSGSHQLCRNTSWTGRPADAKS
jgi:hypothetical protein